MHIKKNYNLVYSNKVRRVLWNIFYWTLFRPFASPFFYKWRILILRCFGAQIDWTAHVYSSVKIWAPWNLTMKQNSCLAPCVDCYNVDKIFIGTKAVVSQKTYLCTASHDITNPFHPLITAPIIIEDQAWIAADAFIGMGVTVGQGAVVGTRSSVYKNVEKWSVVGGNPAKFIKKREIRQNA